MVHCFLRRLPLAAALALGAVVVLTARHWVSSAAAARDTNASGR